VTDSTKDLRNPRAIMEDTNGSSNRSNTQERGVALLSSKSSAFLDTTEHPVHLLQKRAARTAVSKLVATSLVAVAGSKLMGNAYARTKDKCGSTITQSDGKLTQYWCGYRWCAQCSAIRTARAYAGYGQQVREWSDGQLVTLTVPNVTGGNLRHTIRHLHTTFNLCCRSLKKRGMHVELIRATEITYSKKRDDYHPHIHVLVRGKQIADELLLAWLKRHPNARRVAQDVRPANAKSVSELFKYATKLGTDTKDADGSQSVVPAEKLDVIFTAIRSLRLWAAVGVKSADENALGEDAPILDVGTDAVTRPSSFIVWEWSQVFCDWVDFETGECLSGYSPSRHRKKFLSKLEILVNGDPPPSISIGGLRSL